MRCTMIARMIPATPATAVATTFSRSTVVKIRPPLVFQKSHAEEFLTAFDATMAEVDG